MKCHLLHLRSVNLPVSSSFRHFLCGFTMSYLVANLMHGFCIYYTSSKKFHLTNFFFYIICSGFSLQSTSIFHFLSHLLWYTWDFLELWHSFLFVFSRYRSSLKFWIICILWLSSLLTCHLNTRPDPFLKYYQLLSDLNCVRSTCDSL